jgi:hypothetical protein
VRIVLTKDWSPLLGVSNKCDRKIYFNFFFIFYLLASLSTLTFFQKCMKTS